MLACGCVSIIKSEWNIIDARLNMEEREIVKIRVC